MDKCWYCGLEKPAEELMTKKIRRGISKRYLSQFNYEEVYLCPECNVRYEKKEKRAKAGAYFGLIVIFGLMAWSFYMIFQTIWGA